MYKDMMDTIGFVSGYDPELGAAMQRELGRQQANIELIASENIVSPAVMAAMGSVLTNKYAEGYPGHRYYGGCQFVDQVEQIAIDRACKLFGAKYANVQPHSGAQANLAVYFALLNLGDTVMGMDLSQGGHLTHGSPANMSGKNYNFVSYGVSAEDGRIDYDALAKQVAKVRPKLLVAGASAYPRAIDFEKLAEIAHGYGAMLMVDMAHIAGLVAGGMHQNPVPYADVVTTTTHKTLRGPRGGLILTNNAYLIKRINSAIFPGTQGGPLEHVIAAKAVCFGEALKPEFKEYARKIVENAQALAAALQQRGVVALRRFGDGRAFRYAKALRLLGGERLDGGQFGGAVKLQGAAVCVLLRQGQAAALALAADGAGLVFQKLGARGFVVFRAFGQRVFNRFAAVFGQGFGLTVGGRAAVGGRGGGLRARGARRGARSAATAGSGRQQKEKRREKEDFFHHHSAQKISVSEFKLHERALLIIEEAFRFVKEDFHSIPRGLISRRVRGKIDLSIGYDIKCARLVYNAC